jgi:hypothetical protein
MSPPRWARALLRRLVPPDRVDDVLGDLEEVHAERLRRRGRVIASFVTGFESVDVAWAFTVERIRTNGRWRMVGTPETWIRDFTYAARGLLRSPGFTVVTVVTLALAIGGNAAIFSVVKPVLLEPLPFPNADRLVFVSGTAPGTNLPDELGVPDELYLEYRSSVPALEELGIYGTGSSTTRAEGRIEQLFLTQATPSFFATLGVRPALGRLPTDEDDASVVVLSHWLWRDWFGSDPEVLGRSYEFAQQTRTVIGVLPPEFRFPDERTAFWVPFVVRPADVTPGGFGPSLVARMTSDGDREELMAQLQPLAGRVQERLGGPATYARAMEQYRPVVVSLREHMVGNVATPLWILLGTVAIVFLIACTNVANLFMVRAESRRRDLAVRRAPAWCARRWRRRCCSRRREASPAASWPGAASRS